MRPPTYESENKVFKNMGLFIVEQAGLRAER